MMLYMVQMLYQVKIGKTRDDKDRAKKVINYVRNFLDERFPLKNESWKEYQ